MNYQFNGKLEYHVNRKTGKESFKGKDKDGRNIALYPPKDTALADTNVLFLMVDVDSVPSGDKGLTDAQIAADFKKPENAMLYCGSKKKD